MTGPGFDAVIFDSDGVLVDSEALGIDLELAALAAIDLDFEKDDFIERFTGATDAYFIAELERIFRERLGSDLPTDFETSLAATKDRIYRQELQASLILSGQSLCQRRLLHLQRCMSLNAT